MSEVAFICVAIISVSVCKFIYERKLCKGKERFYFSLLCFIFAFGGGESLIDYVCDFGMVGGVISSFFIFMALIISVLFFREKDVF